MQIKSFDDAFELVIGHEGKFSKNPKDPGNWTGGAVGVGSLDGTMYGISALIARAEGYTGPMDKLPLSFAKEVAKRRYWNAVKGDQLPPEISYQLFDIQYNGGRAAQWLQSAVNVVTDGVIGPKTIEAVQAADQRAVIMKLCAYRLKYMASLKILPTFAGGWMNRIADNLIEGVD